MKKINLKYLILGSLVGLFVLFLAYTVLKNRNWLPGPASLPHINPPVSLSAHPEQLKAGQATELTLDDLVFFPSPVVNNRFDYLNEKGQLREYSFAQNTSRDLPVKPIARPINLDWSPDLSEAIITATTPDSFSLSLIDLNNKIVKPLTGQKASWLDSQTIITIDQPVEADHFTIMQYDNAGQLKETLATLPGYIQEIAASQSKIALTLLQSNGEGEIPKLFLLDRTTKKASLIDTDVAQLFGWSTSGVLGYRKDASVSGLAYLYKSSIIPTKQVIDGPGAWNGSSLIASQHSKGLDRKDTLFRISENGLSQPIKINSADTAYRFDLIRPINSGLILGMIGSIPYLIRL